MVVQTKSKQEISAMREGGRVLKSTLLKIKKTAKSGMSTRDLAKIAEEELKKAGMKPAFLGYHGFPDVLCVSINQEVVHGIPSKNRIIKDGDIVSCDFGVVYKGLVTDGAITFGIGEISQEAEKIISTTKQSLIDGIKVLKNGVDTGTLGATIAQTLERAGLGVVKTFVGHGVGKSLHEYPEVPNYGKPGQGVHLVEGMTIAIEPMATAGTDEVVIEPDGWTVTTRDNSLSAHFEDTILVTKNGAEILTSVN